MRIVVAGVCVSGKTTLVKSLRDLGIDAYNVAQEHSAIKKLWNHKQPDILVVLDVQLETIRQRRIVAWGEERLALQRERLRDAYTHADLYIQTDDLSRDDIVQSVLEHIRRNGHAENYC
jgi:RNase adaptor protein for sRNA GlmZ degradation